LDDRGNKINLTGIWQGLYSYPRAFKPVGFVATLIETESWVSGSIHEPHRLSGETLYSTLIGRREGSSISFVKTYEQSSAGGYTADIGYQGLINADATEIEGRWTIRADWSGKFLMIRGAREAMAKAERRFASV
jgi:hypothetical protein